MAANQIKIDTQAVKTAKGVIETKNSDLQDTLNQIYRTIADLVPAHWSGDAATKTQQKMQDFKTKTQSSYNEVLSSYITFIQNTIDTYETNESNTSSNAERQMDSSAVADFN